MLDKIKLSAFLTLWFFASRAIAATTCLVLAVFCLVLLALISPNILMEFVEHVHGRMRADVITEDIVGDI